MALLKLYQVSAPTTATQVSATNQPCTQAIICNSGANDSAYGDKTMTTAGTGITVKSGTVGTLGSAQARSSFDITELYVIAATGNVNILVTCL